VERGCLRVGPDSCPFGTVNVLHDLVLHVAEDMVSGFVFFLADFCADFDEEGIFLESL
jgi:hypothetical protein